MRKLIALKGRKDNVQIKKKPEKLFTLCLKRIIATNQLQQKGNIRLPQDVQTDLLTQYGKSRFETQLPTSKFNVTSINLATSPELTSILDALLKIKTLKHLIISGKKKFFAPSSPLKTSSLWQFETLEIDGRSFMEKSAYQSLIQSGFSQSEKKPANLTSLHFRYLHMKTEQLKTILTTTHSKLRNLTLEYIKTAGNWLPTHRTFSNLTYLSLNGTPVKPPEMKSLCGAMPNLQYLDCTTNSELSRLNFNTLPTLSKLTHFYAKCILFTTFKGLKSWAPNLKECTLNVSKIKTSNQLSPLITWPTITVRLFQHAVFEDDKTDLLSQLSCPFTFTKL